MSMPVPSLEGKLLLDRVFPGEQGAALDIPRSELELARLRLNLAASAFELCQTLELDSETASQVSSKLYEITHANFQGIRGLKSSLNSITDSTLGINPSIYAKVELEKKPHLAVVQELDHSFISKEIGERLRRGQGPAVESLVDYYSSHLAPEARGYLSAPTGAGKTFLFATLLEILRQNDKLPRTYVAEPTRQLVEQTYKEIREKGFGGEVVMLQNGNKRDNHKGDVVIGTYSMLTKHTSFTKNDSLWAIDPKSYGLIILDEAHHMHGGSTQNSLHNHFEHAAWLGFTATPDYDEKRQLRTALPDEIHTITTPEAIDLGLIAPYITGVLTTPTDLSHVNIVGKNYDPSTLDTAINTDVRNHVIAKFAAEMLKDKMTMFNTGSVAHATELAEKLRSYGVKALTVYGGQSPRELQGILKAFHNRDVTALTQAKLLGEGYDEKGIEVVVNVNPSLSYVRQKQRTGRGQRIDSNNPDKVLMVIECIDRRYQRKPVLYGHPEVTGNWTYAPEGIPQTTQDFVYRLENYEDNVSHFTTDAELIESWYQGKCDLIWGKSDRIAELPASSPDAVDLQLILPEHFAKEPKKPNNSAPSRVTKPRSLPLQENIYRNQFDPPRQRQREDLFDDNADENVPSLELVDYLTAAEKGLVNFVLNGDNVPQDIDIRSIKAVLRQLSGTKELRDQSVLDRFTRLNRYLAGDQTLDISNIETDDIEPVTSVGRSNNGSHSKIIAAIDGFKRENGACNDIDQDIFFPQRGASTKEAKAICAGCIVQLECREFAIVNGEIYGIWGGTSERERRRIRKSRRIAQKLIEEAAITSDNT